MRHFVAVAEELHFGRAARRLNISQPPLSQSIARLETDLGVALFNRSRRGVELTDAGGILLEEARRTLQHAELARKLVQRTADKAPEVRVSFIGPALYQLLPDLLVRFHEARPEVNVRLFEAASPEQIHGVRAGDYDVAFITAGLPHPDLESLIVERAPFVAAVPADGPLAKRQTISLLELAEQPFIVPPRKFAAQSEALAVFKHIGLAPQVAQESDQTNTTLSLVAAGLGCSLVMATAALTRPHKVRFLAIEDASKARWELAMAWQTNSITTLARQFVTFAQHYVRANPRLLDMHALARVRSVEVEPPVPAAKV